MFKPYVKYSQAAIIKQTRNLLAGEWLTAGLSLPTCYSAAKRLFLWQLQCPRRGRKQQREGWVGTSIQGPLVAVEWGTADGQGFNEPKRAKPARHFG